MTVISLALCLLMMSAIIACDNRTPDTDPSDSQTTSSTAPVASDLWVDAVYKENTELGSGSKIVEVEVKADSKSVIFTIKTDKDTLKDALLEHDLIAGEESEFGLYVKTVNGITADYDTDGAFWSLSKNGEALNTGVDGAQISNNERYELTYTKA